MTNQDIITQRTVLRKYSESDKNTFTYLFTDKEINQFMGGQNCETKEEAEEMLSKCFEIYNGKFPDRRFEIWGIEFEEKLIGHFELKQTQYTSENELEIVYLLDKDYWGNGLMPEVINGVNKYSSGSGKQLIATISPNNLKTIKALKKTGIEKEEWVEDPEGKVLKIWIKKFDLDQE